jgi:hypothetical protein
MVNGVSTPYFDNSLVRAAGVCATQYFFYELMKYDPERFALASPPNGNDLTGETTSYSSTGRLVPNNGVCSVPFVAGDRISFPISINAADAQKSYVDGSAIPKRTYKIQLVLH